jgi:hypothetical protein
MMDHNITQVSLRFAASFRIKHFSASKTYKNILHNQKKNVVHYYNIKHQMYKGIVHRAASTVTGGVPIIFYNLQLKK